MVKPIPDPPCWPDVEVIEFQRLPDGTIRHNGFPSVVAFSDRWLAEADPRWVQVGDGIVTIRVSNGTASYGLTRPDPARMCHIGIRSEPADVAEVAR